MVLSDGVKERLGVVVDIVQTTFHWGFVPMVLYLGNYSIHVQKAAALSIDFVLTFIFLCFIHIGFSKGAEPGMPPLSLLSLLWQ